MASDDVQAHHVSNDEECVAFITTWIRFLKRVSCQHENTSHALWGLGGQVWDCLKTLRRTRRLEAGTAHRGMVSQWMTCVAAIAFP